MIPRIKSVQYSVRIVPKCNGVDIINLIQHLLLALITL